MIDNRQHVAYHMLHRTAKRLPRSTRSFTTYALLIEAKPLGRRARRQREEKNRQGAVSHGGA